MTGWTRATILALLMALLVGLLTLRVVFHWPDWIAPDIFGYHCVFGPCS